MHVRDVAKAAEAPMAGLTHHSYNTFCEAANFMVGHVSADVVVGTR